nr:DUF3500 domain-containing protein [Actinomadura roseirufa]
MENIERHLDGTHIAWIGGSGDDDAFYYRVHSPVVLIEYDCHRGVFLDNDEPEPFHVHTLVRTPTGATTDATCCAATSPATIDGNAPDADRGAPGAFRPKSGDPRSPDLARSRASRSRSRLAGIPVEDNSRSSWKRAAA